MKYKQKKAGGKNPESAHGRERNWRREKGSEKLGTGEVGVGGGGDKMGGVASIRGHV